MLEPPGQPPHSFATDLRTAFRQQSLWLKVSGALLIALLGIVLYAHTLDFPFHFDDHIYLLGNPFITDMGEFVFGRSFHEVANHSVTLGLGYDPSVNFILRPVAYLTFHLNYLLGGFEPAGFRAVNIGIHCLNAVLLFLLFSHFLRKSPKAAGLSPGSVLFIPLAAALLFVAHPLHTESVTYIVQRFTSLVGLFVLSSIYLHFLSLSAQSRAAAITLRTFAVLATIAGMLTKESMFTAPLLIVMLHIVVMAGTVKRACWQALPHLLCMLIIPTLVLLTSHAQSSTGHLGGAMQIAASTKDPAYQFHYFLTQLGVILEYVRLIVWPQGLNVDRQYQLATSLLQLRVWLSALVLIGILIATWRLYRTKGDSLRHALICAGVFWFFMRLAVSSSFVPLDDLMVDHRTYGASIGVFIVLACGLDLLRTHQHRWQGARWSIPAALAAWVALLSAVTIGRNHVWRSETSLWSDAAMKSPGKARVWDNLGVCHYQEGRQDEALACLTKSVAVHAGYVPGYVKLGIMLNARSRHSDAAEWSRRGLAVAPEHAPLHYNLGAALCGLGKIPEATAAMEQAARFMPTLAPAHEALGKIYHLSRDYPKALHHYRVAASLGSQDPEVNAGISHLGLLVGPQQVAN